MGPHPLFIALPSGRLSLARPDGTCVSYYLWGRRGPASTYLNVVTVHVYYRYTHTHIYIYMYKIIIHIYIYYVYIAIYSKQIINHQDFSMQLLFLRHLWCVARGERKRIPGETPGMAIRQSAAQPEFRWTLAASEPWKLQITRCRILIFGGFQIYISYFRIFLDST